MVWKIQGTSSWLRISIVCLLLGDIWHYVCKFRRAHCILSFLSSIVVYSVSDWSNLCNLHPRHLYHGTYFLLLSKVGTYAAITVGGLDAMDVISRFDQFTGFELANKVDPALGKIGITLVLNEAWEPIRLPFVITTLKPIMDTVNPPKF